MLYTIQISQTFKQILLLSVIRPPCCKDMTDIPLFMRENKSDIHLFMCSLIYSEIQHFSQKFVVEYSSGPLLCSPVFDTRARY